MLGTPCQVVISISVKLLFFIDNKEKTLYVWKNCTTKRKKGRSLMLRHWTRVDIENIPHLGIISYLFSTFRNIMFESLNCKILLSQDLSFLNSFSPNVIL
ncbi:hypothetical protein KP509_08G019400 [Ceratopteris richardii]|uniref:Uncharacterized protein n=1 Tax=Ceratopteris richardii TaxID=49495 RepID=A0A8T2UCB4_CERRI|nr:hypothetical protein KP509_08G019400 [Ceratopteris richardii]